MHETDRILWQAEAEYGMDFMFPCRGCNKPEEECECLARELADYAGEDVFAMGTFEAEKKPELQMPDGWVIWMDCNHDGCIFVGSEENFNYHDISGYSPTKVSWSFALSFIEGEKWNLHICSDKEK